MPDEVYVGVTVSNGSVYHVAFQTRMRCPVKPLGGWTDAGDGTWVREATPENIMFDLWRFEPQWQATDGVSIVRWRLLSNEEHEMFNRDRQHRDALEDAGGRIQHNMPKARELHRNLLRHKRGERLIRLDGEWMRAMGRGDSTAAAAVDARKQMLRDVTDDPRIESAQTLEDLKKVDLPPE